MTLKRMDNVLIVVDDLEAAKAFFVELGMELEGEMPVEGRLVDRVVGLENVRCDDGDEKDRHRSNRGGAPRLRLRLRMRASRKRKGT